MKIVGKVEDKEKHELDVNYLLYTKNKLYSAADDGKIKVGQNNYQFQFEDFVATSQKWFDINI